MPNNEKRELNKVRKIKIITNRSGFAVVRKVIKT
jgi:hypothetical protein